MKKVKFDYMTEAIMILSGIAIAVFPKIIYKIFTFAGIAVIAFNVVRFVLGKVGKTSEYPVSSLVMGLLFGFGITIIPNTIEVGLPIVIGVMSLMAGLDRLRQISQHESNSKSTIIVGGIFSVIGVVMIINPFGTSALIRRIAGFILIVLGVSRIVNDMNTKKRNADIIPDIIETDFTSD